MIPSSFYILSATVHNPMLMALATNCAYFVLIVYIFCWRCTIWNKFIHSFIQTIITAIVIGKRKFLARLENLFFRLKIFSRKRPLFFGLRKRPVVFCVSLKGYTWHLGFLSLKVRLLRECCNPTLGCSVGRRISASVHSFWRLKGVG